MREKVFKPILKLIGFVSLLLLITSYTNKKFDKSEAIFLSIKESLEKSEKNLTNVEEKLK